MRFITNCYDEVLTHKSFRTLFLSSTLKKWNSLGIKAHLKTSSRKFSSELKDLHQNNEDFYNSLVKLDSLQSSNATRNLLYPETDDKIINQLKSCYSPKDVLQIVSANESLTHQQLNQAVLVLRDLQKLLGLHDEEQNIRKLCNSPSFQKMLSLIASNVDKMDATEISYCLLYLNKLKVKCSEPVMMKLIDGFEKSIFQTDKDLVLQNLTRFFIAIKDENNIWSLYTMSSYLPFLIESLDTCDNYDDFRHITGCFQKCVPLLNSDILKKYISKLDLALRDYGKNDDAVARTRTVLKAIVFLNYKHWNSSYINEIRQLMAAMKGKTHHLCFTEVGLLHKAVFSLNEPFDLFQEIEETTKTRIKTYQNTDASISIFEFQLLFPGMKLVNDDELKNYLIEYAGKGHRSSSNFKRFSDLCQIIFCSDLKFNRSITSTYWSILVNLMKDSQQRDGDEFLENLTWCIHKYVININLRLLSELNRVHLNAAANANTSDNLRRDSDSLPEKLNSFHFSYILTKGLKTSEVFAELCNRFQRVKVEQLHSKMIHDSIFNFTICDHLIPEFTDLIIEYCIKEENTLFGITVSNVLNFCYVFGYVPSKMDRFLSVATSLIERDREILPKMMYLQSALALSYFGELPSAWCDYIFNIKFLEQLDDYLNKVNFKKTNLLRRELMELNRVVCIDYPYREVPWFHEKYCRESITLERKRPNEFFTSVLSVVKSLVKAEGAIETDYITSYGHKIDIVLNLSKNGQAINLNECDPTEMRKIALILRSNLPTSYYKGKGRLELFSRQLEMLNFEVILLSRQEWNSMYLSNIQEKTNYLSKLIWPTS